MNLCDLILNIVDEICLQGEKEMKSLELLGRQWSKAAYTIIVGSIRVLPLYIVPVKWYMTLSLESDNVYSLAKLIVAHSNSSAFIKKFSFYESNYANDTGNEDFSVHDQNVKDLIEMIHIVNSIVINVYQGQTDLPKKLMNVTDLMTLSDSDWSTACKIKEVSFKIN